LKVLSFLLDLPLEKPPVGAGVLVSIQIKVFLSQNMRICYMGCNNLSVKRSCDIEREDSNERMVGLEGFEPPAKKL
jgi:hypothetical protein